MNKLILIFSAVVATGRGVADAGILGQYHSQNELHEYAFGYFGGPSAKHETKVQNLTRGGYSYVDPNGQLQTVNYTSDEHGFRVEATNLPTKLGHAIAPVNRSAAYTPGYSSYPSPSYYLVPPPVNTPQIVFYSPPVYQPVPEVIPTHTRSRRSLYPSYAPVQALKHSSIALESTYVPVAYPPPSTYYNPYAYEKPTVKPASPVEYVEKPSYQPTYSNLRSHIPIQEETYDVPEEKTTKAPVVALPAAKLFVPVPTTPPPTSAPTTTAPTTTPPPAYQPYYSPAHSEYSRPAPAQVSTPAPTPEVYIKPLISSYATAPQHYGAPRYEHAVPIPYTPTPAPTTLPPTITTTPAPTTPAPTSPAYVDHYYIPREEKVPIPAKPVAVVPAAPLPAVLATPIRSQFHSQDELGQYTYGYANEISSKQEIKTADGITQGHYSYVDANGEIQRVHYVSDDHHGFRVAATNLPKGPVPVRHDEVVPVPVVIAQH